MQLAEQHPSNGVLRAKGAAARLCIGESTFWLWTRQGKIPQGIRLSPRCTVWRISDLDAFLERQAAHGGVS